MPTARFGVSIMVVAASIAFGPSARAQWAVIDVPAIAQLIQEVQTMEQQLAIAKSQLQSAQQTVQAMTGNRGIDLLLPGVTRNYLPSHWTEVTAALTGEGSGRYGGLSNDVHIATAANAVLSPQRLATLSAADQRQIQTARQWNAMEQALAHEALANASGRFASLQSLISAISTASDQKAILDLLARISAELGMLQNEQTKLQVLHQSAQAQVSSLQQQTREQVVADHGSFESRFQPAP